MKNNPVIVLGLGPAGLFITRQLSVVCTNIYAIGRLDDLGMFSRYIDKSKRYYAVNAEELETAFRAIKEREHQIPELFICSDQYLSILIEEKNRWNGLFKLSCSDFETLELINDKNTINEYCRKQGVRIPQSVSFTAYKEKMFFPAIIKWVEKRIETAVNPIGKVKICRNMDDFKTIEEAIFKGGIGEDELFVQNYIEGRNDNQYSFGGVFSNGELLADVIVNQIKQYPQGISAEVVSDYEGKICDVLRRISCGFAKELGFSGFLEMEYKYDSVSGEVYLLDVNPRPWGWVSILGTVYPDFYKVFNGRKPENCNRDVIWKSPIRILLSQKNKQNVGFDKRQKKYLVAYDIKNNKDKKPSFAIFIMAIKKILKRVKK